MSPIVITDLAVQEGSFHLLTTAHPGRSSRAGLGPSCVPWTPRSSLGLSPGSQDYLPVTSRGRSSRPVRSHFREFSTVALPPPAPVSVLGFTHSRTPHPDVTPTWAVHKAALRPQASEVHCRQDPTLPRTAHSDSDTALLAAATLTARRGEGVCRRLEGACAPRAGSGALWEARAFAASANMAAP